MIREKETLAKKAEFSQQKEQEAELKLHEKMLEFQQISQGKDSEIEQLRQAEKRQRDDLLQLQRQLQEARLALAQSHISIHCF
jgi:hypothetical protein